MTDWTILIATQGRRRLKLERLLGGLLPQVERAEGRVTVEALWNQGDRHIGYIRQLLLEYATSSYISFVDDDDEVPPYFVGTVLPLLDGVDYVGWRQQLYVDGVPDDRVTTHSLRYEIRRADETGMYAGITHLNPIRRALTAGTDFRTGYPDPEDESWCEQLRGRLKTENFIAEVMYRYRFDTADSVQAGGNGKPTLPEHFTRLPVNCPYFTWHPASCPEGENHDCCC